MTKYVYVLNEYDCDPYRPNWDRIHKIFSTEGSAKAYLEDNKDRLFTFSDDPDSIYRISLEIDKVVLEE